MLDYQIDLIVYFTIYPDRLHLLSLEHKKCQIYLRVPWVPEAFHSRFPVSVKSKKLPARKAKSFFLRLCRSCLRPAADETKLPVALEKKGSFSIGDGNCSENVSFKMNSRFFNRCGVYSNLLKMASVGEFSWS